MDHNVNIIREINSESIYDYCAYCRKSTHVYRANIYFRVVDLRNSYIHDEFEIIRSSNICNECLIQCSDAENEYKL